MEFGVDASRAPANLFLMRNNRALFWWIAAFILAVPVITVVVLTFRAPPTATTALPYPNGYAAFLQGASYLQRDTPNFPTMTHDDLRALIQGNTNALQIARFGFGEKVQVPLDYSNNPGKHMAELAGIKSLAQAFLAEGRLAEMEKRPCDAAKSYLDAARLGVECRRGGTLIDLLVGIACEAMGTSQLQMLVPKLDAKCSREVAQELETLDAQKQTWQQSVQQESYWSHRTFPGPQYRLMELFSWRSRSAARTRVEQRFNAQQLKTRKLLIDLAARAYELEKGYRPAQIEDLVPGYLKAIPQDPTAGTNLTYSP